jgi:hypothetical protein
MKNQIVVVTAIIEEELTKKQIHGGDVVAKGSMEICTAHQASTQIMQSSKALEYNFEGA